MHIARLVCRLFKLFIPSFIENVAKSSGFMKRHSKLLPETFAKAMSLGLLDSKNITEEVIAEKCATIQNGVSLTKQAISKRLGDSIPFLQELLKRAFSLIYDNALESHSSLLLNYFSDVKLLDATTISLPDQVADDYVGMGGRNAKAALKIQTLYNAIHHSITDFDITSGVTHDVNILPKVIGRLTEKELLLADLGYFDTAFLHQIQFYTLLNVDLYQFYTIKRITLHTYEYFANLLQRIGKLALHEKRLRKTTYSKIESYLEQFIVTGKT